MMHWDYRVLFEDGNYTICSVYYDERGVIRACSQKSVEPFGESLEELQEELNLLQAALKKKVLFVSDLPAQQVSPKGKKGKSLQEVRQQLGLQPKVAKESCANER
ncbi:MAG: hypothetical protein F6K41_22365 [Symploca sp. SIO3E6]|nr:hypothetical protein [Caldora sp. SIO3E6]